MNLSNALPLALGLVIFSFSITSLLIIPFINLLYKLKLTRQKEAPKKGEIPLFDKLHDIKAGTPIGGGILIVVIVSLIFVLVFPFASHMGVLIRSAFHFQTEMTIILITFVGFGLLGLTDDLVKIFGKGKPGQRLLGLSFGLTRKQKFLLQFVLAFAISYLIYKKLGIQFIHVPFFDKI